ncbi:COesterase domain-containing protein [Aphelenchoides besseyi]|nr:COesterase domain-containing protein [Aphelenchoides besseyi]
MLRLWFLFCVVVSDEKIRIRLSGGEIEGRLNGEVMVFQQIPFLEPPVGALRFEPPVTKRSWSGVLNTTQWGPPCAQKSYFTFLPLNDSREDCLHMNVFADRRCLDSPCPIIYYVHGGGYHFDSPTMFNETEIVNKIAAHRTVFVMPSYRLGLFGWIDLEGVRPNLGLLDLIAGVRWCQSELASFGGDTRQMTIFGSSAGGSLVLALLSSPFIERSAFKRAVVSSGMLRLQPHINRPMTLAVLNYTGCVDVKCLKSKPMDELLDAQADTEHKEWLDASVQTNTETIPLNNVLEFLANWKGIEMIFITTEVEFELADRATALDKCEYLCDDLGYMKRETVELCAKQYADNINQTFRDAMHAFQVKFAALNTRLGYPTFNGLFAQPHGLRHASDLKYLLGLHQVKQKNRDDERMDEFYPEVVRRFVHLGAEGMKDWTPTDEWGRNFLLMKFENTTVQPHMVNGVMYHQNETNFWIKTLKKVDEGVGAMESFAAHHSTILCLFILFVFFFE